MSEVLLECKLARNYALENVSGSLAYLLIKATPNPAVNFDSLPLNLGLVIDVSASMKGDKIKYARDASKFVIESLSPDDMVTVVIFSDDARAIVPHSEVREIGPILSAIDKIRPVSGTRMYKGIETAVAEMSKARNLNYTNSMLLLTDGETEGGERCLEISRQEAKNRLTISTFGIGDKYNEELLKSIADATLGKTYHLQTAEQIKSHFDSEVSAARAAVITDITLNIRVSHDVKLEEIHRIFPSSTEIHPRIEPDGKTYTVDITSLSKNEPSYFGIKMILPARAGGRITEAQISLKYDIPNRKIEGHTEECDVIIEYTKDRDLCSTVDREVINYFNQLNVESLINQAIEETKIGNVAQATKILSQAQMLTQRIGNSSLTQYINNASEELIEKGAISSGALKTIKIGASHTVKIDTTDVDNNNRESDGRG